MIFFEAFGREKRSIDNVPRIGKMVGDNLLQPIIFTSNDEENLWSV